MSSKTPDRGPHHADDTGGDKVILVEFTLQAMPCDQDPLKGERKERVTRLHGECQRLVELSNDFLRFARVQELTTRPAPLDEVVGRMIDFLLPTARQKNVEINWFPAPDLPPVCLDVELFEQALLNLMLNAEQAMPDGGTLTLIGRVEGGDVCLDVIDTGHGMPADVLAKLFRPFHTTKQNGHGLGLPTTRKIVLAHGGSIDVQSEPGRGTKFTIRLPAAAGEPGA